MSSHPTPLTYQFLQTFGEQNFSNKSSPTSLPTRDNVSCIRFSPDGSLIAVGDYNGRIIIMHRQSHSSLSPHFRTTFVAPSVRSPIHNLTQPSDFPLSAPSSNTIPAPISTTVLPRRRTRFRRRSRSRHFFFISDQTRPAHTHSTFSPHASATLSLSDCHSQNDSHHRSENTSPKFSNLSANSPPSYYTHNHHSHKPITRHRNRPPTFDVWTQFQSHHHHFDHAKRLESDEKVNQICWCRPCGDAHRLISANDTVVKIWNLAEQNVRSVARLDLAPPNHQTNHYNNAHRIQPPSSFIPDPPPRRTSLIRALFRRTSSEPQTIPVQHFPPPPPLRATSVIHIPRLEERTSVVGVKPKRVYSQTNLYQINSLSVSSDDCTFLASDDVRVRIWDLNTLADGYFYLDAMPNRMKSLTEIITCARFHPSEAHTLALTTSRGIVRFADLRSSRTCKSFVSKYEWPRHHHAKRSLVTELTASICDLSFSSNGLFFLTRDYMTLRLWDVRKETGPVLTLPVHEHLRPFLPILQRKDYIFDRFQCCFSGDGGSLLTGSYHGAFHSYSAIDGSRTSVEATVDAVRGKARYAPGESPFDETDFTRGVIFLDASPAENIAAVAAGTALYLYAGHGRS